MAPPVAPGLRTRARAGRPVSAAARFNADDALTRVLTGAREAYVAANPRSRDRFITAARYLPGGNTRTVLHYDPYPLGIERAEGARLWDLDGHEYLDFLGEYTAGLYGHSHPLIARAVHQALERGVNIGGPGTTEVELARLICERFASIERVRFTNSGTEANLLAIAAAVAHTGRREVLVFRRGYHGSVLSFGDHGPSINVPHHFIVADYNDIEGTGALIDAHGATLAAILVEPMLGSGGCIPGTPAFLSMLRARASANGALLIFDEVMTSRLSAGGRQALLGVYPDLTTLGKYIGGGMSFGAFGGRADVMERFDPTRADALAHAGTFNNNALTMAAGVVALSDIYTAPVAHAHNARGDALRARLNSVCSAAGSPLQWTGLGSLMAAHFTSGALPLAGVDEQADRALGELFFLDMLRAGVYLARRGFVALSLSIGDPECDALVAAVERFLDDRGSLFRAVT